VIETCVRGREQVPEGCMQWTIRVMVMAWRSLDGLYATAAPISYAMHKTRFSASKSSDTFWPLCKVPTFETSFKKKSSQTDY
jgi:hypothetical protein